MLDDATDNDSIVDDWFETNSFHCFIPWEQSQQTINSASEFNMRKTYVD